MEGGRHCLSFRSWFLFGGPWDLYFSLALRQTSCVTLDKSFHFWFLNHTMGTMPAPPSMLRQGGWLGGRKSGSQGS